MRAARTEITFAADCKAAARWTLEVQMTDVFVPALIPYARFLEVRARRLRIVTELAQPVSERPMDATVASTPAAIDGREQDVAQTRRFESED